MAARKRDPLATYKAKRNLATSGEPGEGGKANPTAPVFVVQKHWATRLHYDFRLEIDGSMKSWAIPKGPSFDPRDKRMAVHVEDHPLAYNAFEGDIPPGHYGAGKVVIWDKGTWTPLEDARRAYATGHLKFELHGLKLRGRWALVRMKQRDSGAKEAWLLIKEKDAYARSSDEYSVVDAEPDSVAHADAAPVPTPTPASKASPRKAALTAASLPREAKPAAVPASLSPQLATLVDAAPGDSTQWIYEIKFDGYRMLARVGDRHRVRLFTRTGLDWTGKLAPLVTALEGLKLAPGWLDGEIVMLNERGVPDFQALQNAFDTAHLEKLVYYLFDIPFYAGHDLRPLPLTERKRFLAALLAPVASDVVRYSESFSDDPASVLASACRMGLEGIIGKRSDAPYVSRRSSDWIKLKCTQRQEFVVGGYTDPRGTRTGFGALLLGVRDDAERLVYAGKVGTGFDQAGLARLAGKLAALEQARSPFSGKVPDERGAHWISPTLVAEVSFGEWTRDGRIRHAVFHGLRSDKPASVIRREQPRAVDDPPPQVSLPRVSHPERVVDPSTRATKRDLVQFYARVAPLMMMHLDERPVALLRAPQGIEGPLFFQKHIEATQLPGVIALDPALDPGHDPLLEIASPEGLLAAAQMNVVEFHTWNARKTHIARPDRMTFDLDPGEGVDWPVVQASAHLVREFLGQLELASFVKTSGGKGVHIVVPLKRLYDWDTVKGFSQAIVQHLAATLPQRFAAKSGPRNRVGRIFIDYLRNGFGATTAAAWSVRARPGLGVSVPLAWSELDAVSSAAQWTLANLEPRLAIGNAPWDGYANAAQSLGRAMKTLGFDARAASDDADRNRPTRRRAIDD